MSKTILAEVDGFTPLIDGVVQEVGIMAAAVFGKAWRYCQMSDSVCKASQERLAEELGMDRTTINKHLKTLVDAGYLEDKTPTLKGVPRVANNAKTPADKKQAAKLILDDRAANGK